MTAVDDQAPEAPSCLGSRTVGRFRTRKTKLRLNQARPLVRPVEAIDVWAGHDQIQASPEHVTRHIENLWLMTYREIALDVGRDPRDTNVAIVRLVADMKLAQATRRVMIAAWFTVTVTAVGVIVAILVR